MYNEIYFASTEECNDPFDSKTFNVFDKDVKKWTNFILLALQSLIPRSLLTPERLQAFTEYLCSKCPLTFDDLIYEDVLRDFPIKAQEDDIIKSVLQSSIPQIARIYKPSQGYFVSFSKDPTEPLMWAHYANKFNGFCLIFKPINGVIKQFEFQKKRQIRRQTDKGIASSMSYVMPEEFKLIDIQYPEKVIPSRAFLNMPVAVSGKAKNDQDVDKIREEQQMHYFQKGRSWSYEKEARIILTPPPSYLFGEAIQYSSQERLFHYDPSHLVGIIYGSRLSETSKKRIQEIIEERREWELSYPQRKRISFDFVEFQAFLSKSERKIEIEPIAINTYKRIIKGEDDFDYLLRSWEDGWGYETDDHSSRKVKVE